MHAEQAVGLPPGTSNPPGRGAAEADEELDHVAIEEDWGAMTSARHWPRPESALRSRSPRRVVRRRNEGFVGLPPTDSLRRHRPLDRICGVSPRLWCRKNDAS